MDTQISHMFKSKVLKIWNVISKQFLIFPMHEIHYYLSMLSMDLKILIFLVFIIKLIFYVTTNTVYNCNLRTEASGMLVNQLPEKTERKKSRNRSICPYPWCKYFHHCQFRVAESLTSGPQNSWILNNWLFQAQTCANTSLSSSVSSSLGKAAPKRKYHDKGFCSGPSINWPCESMLAI